MRNQEQIQKDIFLLECFMKQKLQENEHKGYWADCSLIYLANRAQEELDELVDAILTKSADQIMREAADLANFAMMICSNASRNQICNQPVSIGVDVANGEDWSCRC